MDFNSCEPDQHFLFGTLNIKVVPGKSRRSVAGLTVLVGVTEDEVIRQTCKARRLKTGPDGCCSTDFPIGKAVVALNPKNFTIAWVALDQLCEVEIEI